MFMRVLHTVRHLKPVQVYSRVWRSRPSFSHAALQLRRQTAQEWQPCILRPNAEIALNRFRFLNEERQIRTWNDRDIPKLWLYNLHYFESADSDRIRRWILENPPGHGIGWEPYPLSQRIPNWIKWCLAGNPLDTAALASLATQALALHESVEYHLQANHLFVNGKALVFAGSFFEGAVALAWLKAGLDILCQQVPEQVLRDGGHFERSPMYHSLILEDLLDLVNLAQVFPAIIPQEDAESWTAAASRMLGWLAAMCHPDGRIAFFNDTAFGIAPEPHELGVYAERLGVAPIPASLGDSGYIRLENSDATVIFDAAPIGPDYQPGHAHADTLSFELSIRGLRVLVNSGTSVYESGDLRSWQRSTAAHNTATVDGLDSSEVWSAFRVARRARPFDFEKGAGFAAAAH